MWVKYLLMQRQQQTVELRFQHPAPHAERRIEHLAQTLRRGRRGEKRETEHPHSQITHTQEIWTVYRWTETDGPVWKDKLSHLQSRYK